MQMPASKTVPQSSPQKLETIRRRADFLAAARAAHSAQRGLVLQARVRDDERGHRVGFTVTKKVGNAVVRNRVKRRLRAAARLELSQVGRPGVDYVLIGRKATINRDFALLRDDLAKAVRKVHMETNRREGAL
ncbi:MAG: ribonuclease P protein component [Pseudomonadota bacterium]